LRGTASPVRGGIKFGAELIGGGMLAPEPLASEVEPLDELPLDELPPDEGRVGVAAEARDASDAVQAIGMFTDANAAPAEALTLTLPVIVRSAVKVIVAVPPIVVALSVLIVPPEAMKSTVVPSGAGLPAASFAVAKTKTVPPQRSTAPGFAANVSAVAAAAVVGVPCDVGEGQKT
jgi:hypothetical protein